MKFYILMFLFFALVEGVVKETPSNEYRILKAGGCFHGKEVSPVEDNNNWYGIFKAADGFELQSVYVLSYPCHDIVIDNPGDTTGTFVKVDTESEPIILIQGIDFKTGPISSASDAYRQLLPGVSYQLQNSNGYCHLYVTGRISDEEGRRNYGDLLITDYLLTIQSAYGEVKQQLVSYERMGMDGVPQIIWSGDVDRDGKCDFLLDITNHYNLTHYVLYLSSKSDKDNMVKAVAELKTSGC